MMPLLKSATVDHLSEVVKKHAKSSVL